MISPVLTMSTAACLLLFLVKTFQGGQGYSEPVVFGPHGECFRHDGVGMQGKDRLTSAGTMPFLSARRAADNDAVIIPGFNFLNRYLSILFEKRGCSYHILSIFTDTTTRIERIEFGCRCY